MLKSDREKWGDVDYSSSYHWSQSSSWLRRRRLWRHRPSWRTTLWGMLLRRQRIQQPKSLKTSKPSAQFRIGVCCVKSSAGKFRINSNPKLLELLKVRCLGAKWLKCLLLASAGFPPTQKKVQTNNDNNTTHLPSKMLALRNHLQIASAFQVASIEVFPQSRVSGKYNPHSWWSVAISMIRDSTFVACVQ